MSNSPAEEFVGVAEGPLAIVRYCTLCNFRHTRRKRPGVGRGNGFREGNKQRGLLIQHVKECHPEALAKKDNVT